MQFSNNKIQLNLTINPTYYSLFNDSDALKSLANDFIRDYNQEKPLIEHEPLPEWKAVVLEDLHDLLKTEEEGRLFGTQLAMFFEKGFTLDKTVTARNLVIVQFCEPQDKADVISD